MPRDLDDELLRVARDYLVEAGAVGFTCDDLLRFICDSRPTLRLAHPYLHGQVDALAATLAQEGLLACDGATFRLTERACAHLDRQPELLIEPDSPSLADKVGT
jgi:hypothetical protein